MRLFSCPNKSEDKTFSTEDIDFYVSWGEEKGGFVSLFIPDIGEVRMTFAKAEDIGEDIVRKAEYGRWHAMEEQHELQKNPQHNEVE